MTSVRPERPRRATSALLVYGVLRQAPDSTIDDTLAAGRQIPARSFELQVLEPGRELGATGEWGSLSCAASRSC